MLPITAKIRTLVDELEKAMSWCERLEYVLANSHNSSQLAEQVGEFAIELSNFNILTDERKGALDIVREICTGELPTEEAYDLICQCHEELKYTRSLLNL